MTEQTSQSDIDAAVAAARKAIADSWGWFLALGIVLLLAGAAAIAFPLLSTIAAKIALGWIFLVGGAVLTIHAFSIKQWSGFLWSFLIGVLYLVAGGWLAFFPFTGIVTLTILLAALFLAEGVLEAIMAVRVRPHEGWGWLLLSGLVAIAVTPRSGLVAPPTTLTVRLTVSSPEFSDHTRNTKVLLPGVCARNDHVAERDQLGGTLPSVSDPRGSA